MVWRALLGAHAAGHRPALRELGNMRSRRLLRFDSIDLDFGFVAEGVRGEFAFGEGVDVGFFGLDQEA